jgi:predicted phosphohydrolase
MGLYAIGDLHLPGGDQKPMDVFGAHWENHFDRIRADWRARVSEDDTVLIRGTSPGPCRCATLWTTWPGSTKCRAQADSQGNHDYWWSSITPAASGAASRNPRHPKRRGGTWARLCLRSRGWVFPDRRKPAFPEDQRSASGSSSGWKSPCRRRKARGGSAAGGHVALPPCTTWSATLLHGAVEKHPVHTVVYGHLHGAGIRVGFTGSTGGCGTVCFL